MDKQRLVATQSWHTILITLLWQQTPLTTSDDKTCQQVCWEVAWSLHTKGLEDEQDLRGNSILNAFPTNMSTEVLISSINVDD